MRARRMSGAACASGWPKRRLTQLLLWIWPKSPCAAAIPRKRSPAWRGHLRYRLRFAEIYERLNRADSAVRLYQQILSDASLRELPVLSARSGGRERPEPLPLAVEPERREHTIPAGTLADARIG